MHCDLCILGSGPAGFRAAIDAAQAGLSTLLVEKEDLGGTCLNWGCIPTKLFLGATEALAELKAQSRMRIAAGDVRVDLAALQRRKQTLLKGTRKAMATRLDSAGVQLIRGHGRLAGPDTVSVTTGDEELTVQFNGLIIAAGTAPAKVPGIPVDGRVICTSNDLLDLEEVPERLAVIGAGAIGIELAQFWSRMGSAITLVEMAPAVAPAEDPEISSVLASAFKRQGWKIHTGTKVEDVAKQGKKAELTLSNGKTVRADKVLLAAGRRPDTAPLHLDRADIESAGPGWIRTDAFLRATENIYAVGDVNGRILLAHAAEDQACYAVRHFTGRVQTPYPDTPPPSCIYGSPEVFRAGRTHQELAGKKIAVSTFHLVGNPLAHAHASTQGLIKVFWHEGRVAGITGVGYGVASLVTLAEVIVKQAWDREAVHEYIFAHPTLDESLREALLAPAQELEHE